MSNLIQLIKQKKFRTAETLLRNVLAESPEDVYTLTQLANVLWNRYKDEDALNYADKAKDISPINPLVNYTRGRILWSLERYEQSVEEWDILLSMTEMDVAKNGYGIGWAKSVINDSRYYKADCLYHLFRDREALVLMEEHLEHRRRGKESDLLKKEAVLFYKRLKYSMRPKMAKTTDDGYASESQRNRISKRIDSLERNKNWAKMVGYLKVICTHYPNEYYLKTILSEYYKTLGNTAECLVYAKEAFVQEPYDPLVKYNYAVALALNRQEDKALAQFEEIVALGVDYIGFSEHGEGIRWAKKLLRDTQHHILEIKHCENDMH